MNSVIITIEPEGRKIRAKNDSTAMRALSKSGVGIRSDCGGIGECGKCRIIIKDQSKTSCLTKVEKKQLTELDIKTGCRLACQLKIKGDLLVFIPPESRIKGRKFLNEGFERPVKLNPVIKKVPIQLPKPTLLDPKPDFERLVTFLKDSYGIRDLEFDVELLKSLPEMLRKSDWNATLVLWNDRKLLSIEVGDTTNSLYGVSVDIGTSKIVASLISLLDGETLATSSIENPQMIHGEDILSRISYTMTSENELGELTSLAIEGVNTVILDICARANISPNCVYEAVIAGNTAMHHIFLGLQTRFLARAPYTPVVKQSMNLKAEKIGVKINSKGNIHLPPIIAGFVGSDDVCDIVSTGIHKKEETSLLLDIGTNTEVNIGNKDSLLCCSCASGPAFEGGHITYGMKAVDGAIEKATLNPKTLRVEYESIGQSKPVGICGSAMIDILAEMLKNHLLDETGRFQERLFPKLFKKRNGRLAFTIVKRDETETGKEIVITQSDIRELQLAKAAVYTGCWMLMNKQRIKAEDLRRVYVAGAFGRYIDVKNAKIIGLIPDVSADRIKLVGNTALTGAKTILKSRRARMEAEELSRKVEYLELGADPNFNREFSKATFFPHMDLSRFPSVRESLNLNVKNSSDTF